MAGDRPVSAATLDLRFRKGLTAHQSGRLDEAESWYRDVLRQNSRHAGALHFSGLVAHQRGDHNTASRLMEESLAIDPSPADWHSNLGIVRRSLGQLPDAMEAFDEALRRSPGHLAATKNLADTCRLAGDLSRAVSLYQRIEPLCPNDAVLQNTIGECLAKLDRPVPAVERFRKALALKPNWPVALNNLGAAMGDVGQWEESLRLLREVTTRIPTYAEAFVNLGIALQLTGHLDEAIAAFASASDLRPGWAIPWSNLGFGYQCAHQFEASRDAHGRALSLDPDSPIVRRNRAMLLLLLGEYEHGWADYECRLSSHDPVKTAGLPAPVWDGSDPADKTMFLHTEQGIGDSVQFVRFAKILADRGARVILGAPEMLAALLRSAPGVDRVVTDVRSVPRCDFQVALASLPHWLKINESNIPCEVSYLRATPQAIGRWAQWLGPRQRQWRVGLVWAGNPKPDPLRTCPQRYLSILGDIVDCEFISLQKLPPDQRIDTPDGLLWRDPMSQVNDLNDTAAIVSQLDLVISIDTGVAHLAGALNVPTWLLLPHAPDFRWRMASANSPWYPSIRIYRQSFPGDWEGVWRQVTHDLHAGRGRRSFAATGMRSG